MLVVSPRDCCAIDESRRFATIDRPQAWADGVDQGSRLCWRHKPKNASSHPIVDCEVCGPKRGATCSSVDGAALLGYIACKGDAEANERTRPSTRRKQ